MKAVENARKQAETELASLRGAVRLRAEQRRLEAHTPQPPAGDDLVARDIEVLQHFLRIESTSASMTNEPFKTAHTVRAAALAHVIEALTSQHTEPVAGEVEVVAYRDAHGMLRSPVTYPRPWRDNPDQYGLTPLVTKSSYDALAAALAHNGEPAKVKHSYGDLDAGASNYLDHSKRGFEPK